MCLAGNVLTLSLAICLRFILMCDIKPAIKQESIVF